MDAQKAKRLLRNSTAALLAAYGFAAVFSPAAQARNQEPAGREKQSVPKTSAHGAPLIPTAPPPSTRSLDPKANPPGAGPQRSTHLFDFRHPQTKETMRVYAGHSSDETLRRFSPKNWTGRLKQNKELWNSFTNCGTRHNGVINELIEEIPLETLGFALFTLGQSWMMSGGDPGALKRLYEQNIADPVAYVAIITFVGAFQGTDVFFRMTGLTFDPCKGRTQRTLYQTAAGRVFGNAPLLPAANRFHKIFGPLAPGIAMGVGMGASVFVSDILKDKDMQLCVQSKVMDVDKDASAEACERAYEVWTVGRKMNQYFPDIFSMVASYFISSYAAMPAAMGAASYVGKVAANGASRFIPVIWNKITIAWKASLFATPNAIQWGLQIGTMIVMVPIQTVLGPRIKSFWNTWRIHGVDVRDTTALLSRELERLQKTNWAWSPERKICYPTPPARMDLADRAATPVGLMGKSIAPVADGEDCTDYQTGLPEAIKKYGQRQSEWRQFLLEAPIASHEQWKDYVLKFQNRYTAAYNFYEWFVAEVAFQNKARKLGNGKSSSLFISEPLRGISVMSLGPDGQPVSAGEETTGVALKRAVDYIKTQLDDRQSRLSPPDRASLRRIQLGLLAADKDVPIKALRNLTSKARARLQAMSEQEREEMLFIHRMSEVSKAVRLLNEILETHPLWNTSYAQYPSRHYETIAARNPFAAIRLLLGNPRPTAPGLEALRWVDSEPSIFEQELKDDHPKSMGARLLTPTMSDYMLASMICGPEADPSDAQILEEQHRRDTSFLTRAWEKIIGDKNAHLKRKMSMIDIQAVREDVKAPKSAWMNPNKELSLIIETKLIDATFYPPRLVKPLGRDVCTNAFPDEGFSRSINYNTRPMFQIHEGVWKIDGRKYRGLLGVAKHNLRPEMFKADGTESDFEEWWAKNVDPAVIRTAEAFSRKFYEEVLEGQFFPALTGEAPDYYVELGNKMNGKFNGGALMVGVLPSLRAELQTYLDLIQKAHARARVKADMAAFNAKRKELENLFQLTTDIFMRPETGEKAVERAEAFLRVAGQPPMRGAKRHEKIKRINDVFLGLKTRMEEASKAIKDEVLRDVAPDDRVQAPADRKQKKVPLDAVQTRVAIVLSSLEKIGDLAKETDFYLALTKSVYLTGLYERGTAKNEQALDQMLDELLAETR